MSKDKTKSKKTETEDAPRLGKLGGFHGFAITAVIRAMAKAGWEYWECRAVFDSEKIAVADNTIRIQLSAGRAGKGGAPAELSKKFLADLRPDADDKPAAARKVKSTKKVKAKSKPVVEDDDEEVEETDEDEAPAPKKAKKKSKPAPVEEDEEEEAEEEEPADGDDE